MKFQDLKKIGNATILEIGGMDGSLSTNINRMFRSVEKHYIFEPDPRNIKKIRSKRLPKSCVLIPKAIGNKDGKMTFWQSNGTVPTNGKNHEGAGSILKPTPHLKEKFGYLKHNKITVDCITLDTFCKQYGIKKIDFIHADMQGAERYLWENGRSVINNVKYMFLEIKEDKEIYEGQSLYTDMVKSLPQFEVVYKDNYDALFRNTTIKPKRGCCGSNK